MALNELKTQRAQSMAQLNETVAKEFLSGDELSKYLNGDCSGIDSSKLTQISNTIKQRKADIDTYYALKENLIYDQYDLQRNPSYQALKDEEFDLEIKKVQLEADKAKIMN